MGRPTTRSLAPALWTMRSNGAFIRGRRGRRSAPRRMERAKVELRDQDLRPGGEDGEDGLGDVLDGEAVGRVAPAGELGGRRARADRRHLDPEVAELEHARL